MLDSVIKVLNLIRALPQRRRVSLAGAVLLLFLLLIFPFNWTVVPIWTIHVVDSSATTGLKGMQVTEHWQDYSVESESHEQSLMTNIEGRVIFPGRSVRASILRRGWGTLTIFISRGFNGRYGAHASAVVWGNEEHQVGVSTFRPDDTGDTEIVIR